MCEANVYIEKDGKEELYFESVYLLKPEGDQILMVNIFGEQRVLRARFLRLDLAKEKIVLKPEP